MDWESTEEWGFWGRRRWNEERETVGGARVEEVREEIRHFVLYIIGEGSVKEILC